MAYLGTGRDKKSRDYDLRENAKSHAARLSGAFRRVKGKFEEELLMDLTHQLPA